MADTTLDLVFKFILGLSALIVPLFTVYLQTVLAERVEKVHSLVNSAYSVQLKLTASTSRRLAAFTKLPEDEVAATLAEDAYTDNLASQKKAAAKE